MVRADPPARTEPTAPTTLFLATVINGDMHTSQVTSTRDAALYWLTTQIPQREWEAFYDHLPRVSGPA